MTAISTCRYIDVTKTRTFDTAVSAQLVLSRKRSVFGPMKMIRSP